LQYLFEYFCEPQIIFMKVKLLVTFFFIFFQIGYSQTEKRINGSVVCIDFALQGIEVANLVSKNTTITNNSGNFSILAKAGDQLVFISKKYEYKTITLKQADFEKTNFVITLIKKPEELDEVVVFKMPNIKLSKKKVWEQGKLDELALEKESKRPKTGVYDGTIPNGMNLIRIGNMILSVFIKEKEKTKAIPEIKFKTLVNSSLDKDFFNKTLALQPEEVNLFLEFCDADATSITILENPNPLKIMDFLFLKNAEFKKLSQ
jgi:hypothetical protein